MKACARTKSVETLSSVKERRPPFSKEECKRETIDPFVTLEQLVIENSFKCTRKPAIS